MEFFSLLDLNSDGELTADEFLNGSLHLRGNARALEMEVMMRAISESNEVVRDVKTDVSDVKNDVLHILRNTQSLLSLRARTGLGSMTEPLRPSQT